MKNKIWIIAALLMLAIGQVSAAEKITYYHLDALGSPIAATDENGNLAWKEAYKPYGERIRKEDGGSNSTWYTGKQEDADNGLTYFGARWYDPSIGRFMGIDPVGVMEDNVHSFNRFAYANNNPYKFMDPDGKESVIVSPFSPLPSPAAHPVFQPGSVANNAFVDSTNRIAENLKWILIRHVVDSLTLTPYSNESKKDNSKHEKHGDRGRAIGKSQDQIDALNDQLTNATGREKKKIQQKIKNIKKTAKKKATGEEHNKVGKR